MTPTFSGRSEKYATRSCGGKRFARRRPQSAAYLLVCGLPASKACLVFADESAPDIPERPLEEAELDGLWVGLEDWSGGLLGGRAVVASRPLEKGRNP